MRQLQPNGKLKDCAFHGPEVRRLWHRCNKQDVSACADLERVFFSFITPIFCFLTAFNPYVFEFAIGLELPHLRQLHLRNTSGKRQDLPGAACSIAVDREGLFPTGWEVIWENWN